jgi:hypothetical protein
MPRGEIPFSMGSQLFSADIFDFQFVIFLPFVLGIRSGIARR